jgi:hypothetical protein
MRKSLLAATTATMLAAALGLSSPAFASTGSAPPTARLAVTPTPIPSTGQWKAVFDASGSTAGSAPLTSYTFSFGPGDGGTVTQSTPVLTRTFTQLGQDGVGVAVSDADGQTSGTNQPFTVGGRYKPLGPVRILDTRSAVGVATTTPVPSNGTVSIPVTGHNGVPATGVVAVVLNVTATAPSAMGFVTVYPDGQPRPTTSNVDWTAGQTIANSVTVPVVNGKVDLYNGSSGKTHFVADLAGYHNTGAASRLTSVQPVRILDTRSAVGVASTTPVRPDSAVSLQVAGRDGVPTTGVTAVVLNVTVTDPTAVGYVTAYPDGQPRPVASNMDWIAHQTIANLVTVPVMNGKVDLYNGGSGTAHLIADLAGYYGTYGSVFSPDGPARLLDTRTGLGVPATWQTPIAPGGDMLTQIGGVAGVPDDLVTGLVLNVTTTDATGTGYLSVYSNGATQPLASNLDWVAGQTVANQVIPYTAELPSHGPSLWFHNGGTGTVQVVVDLLGYFGGAVNP